MKQTKTQSPDELCINTIRMLSIEAGVEQGWEKFAGSKGAAISIERFGSYAPSEIVMEKYGFNVKNVCRRALAVLKSNK